MLVGTQFRDICCAKTLKRNARSHPGDVHTARLISGLDTGEGTTLFAAAQRVHFIGIGGIGMSGIAEILLSLGFP